MVMNYKTENWLSKKLICLFSFVRILLQLDKIKTTLIIG